MQKLVKKAKHVPSLLPSWKPEFPIDVNLAKHISELHIPTVSGRPSLLLHALGEEGGLYDDRIARVFSLEKHMCVP